MQILFCATLYAFIDYVGYGIIQNENHEAPVSYRIFQVLLWIPIFLWLSFSEFVGFFILWWTFCLDWFYYAFTVQSFGDRLARFLRKRFGFPRVGWDDWADTISDFQNGITHAYWTPLGILMGLDKSKPAPQIALIMQSVIGVFLAYLCQR